MTKHKIIPRAAVQSVGIGLFIMAFFTAIWATISWSGLDGRDHDIELIFFGILSLVFIINGISMFSKSQRFPPMTDEHDITHGKKMGMWFGIIFGAEGLGIFIAVNVVTNIGHSDLVIPVIALVVGLHFYPLGWLFKRTIDYYLATWATLVAVCAIILTLNKSYDEQDMFAFTGAGIAIATSCYGLYMTRYGRRLILKIEIAMSSAN